MDGHHSIYVTTNRQDACRCGSRRLGRRAAAARRWQFSLRRLGIFVAVLCSLLALGVKCSEPYRNERRLLRHLDALGVHAYTESYGPLWLRRLLGEYAPYHITIVNCQDAEVTDGDLMELRTLARLRELDLSAAGDVTDRGLEEIGKMSMLERLVVLSPRITDRGIASLGALTNLRDLWLPGHISDEAIDSLGSLASLETLVCATPAPAQKRIVEALFEKTETDFTEQPLAEVLDY